MRIIIALAFLSQWCGNGLVSYYLSKVFDSVGITDPTIQASYFFTKDFRDRFPCCDLQLLLNAILQLWNLFWALLAASLVDRVGRRFLFLTSTVGMFVFFSLQTVCS